MGLSFDIEGLSEKERDEAPMCGYGTFSGLLFGMAVSSGIDILDMRGYGGKTEWKTIDHPLAPLYCIREGKLSSGDCRTLIPAIRDAVKGWPDYDDEFPDQLTEDDFMMALDKGLALRIADFMETAVRLNSDLLFN